MGSLVIKFGGTPAGSADALAQAAGIVQEQARDRQRLVVVVSAMSGVTEALIRGARTTASGDGQVYRSIVTDLCVLHLKYPEKVRSILGGYTG